MTAVPLARTKTLLLQTFYHIMHTQIHSLSPSAQMHSTPEAAVHHGNAESRSWHMHNSWHVSECVCVCMWGCVRMHVHISEWLSALTWVHTCACVWLLHRQTTFQHVSVVATTTIQVVPPPWHHTPLLYTVYLIVQTQIHFMSLRLPRMYTLSNKNQAAWNFVCSALEMTWYTVANIFPVILLSPYLCTHGTSQAMHYNQSINQSCHIHINQRPQNICLIWS